MAANGTEIVQRFDKLEQARANHDVRWERMAPHLAPSRVGITGAYADGDKQTRGVYDSTTMYAAELMAHFIAGYVINPSQRWLTYKLDNFQQEDEETEWLEECRDRALRRLASSAFYAEGAETLIDWGGFGTGWLLGEERPQPTNETIRGFRGFRWEATKTGRFVIAEGTDGRVDTGGRKFQMTAEKINERWGPNGRERVKPLPENIRKAIESKELDKQFTIIHMIMPRPRIGRGPGALGMPWASVWCEKESKEVLGESGYHVFPVAGPRYHKTPGEVFGRGRGDLAWPDTFSLNSAKRMGFEDWALKIRPPVLHQSESIIGTLKLVPGGPTSVNTHGRNINEVITPFQTGSHPEVSQLKEEELRKSIRQIFFVDQILQLLEVHKSEMKAYEFAKKIELLFRLIGPVYGRLQWEFLYAVGDITFLTMFHGRDFSPPPRSIERTDGEIGIEFDNPISRAQKSEDADALVLAVNDLAPLAQVYPNIFDRLDPDRTASGIFEVRGIPALWQRNEEEQERLRAAREEQDRKEAALTDVAQLAEASKNIAPMAKVLQNK